MKNYFLVISFLIFATTGYAQQEEYNFKPAWKVGEKKVLSWVSHEKEYEQGVLIKDTTEFFEAALHVVQDTKDEYVIKLFYENIVLRSAKEFYDKFDEEIQGYKTLELEFKVNKLNGKVELMNWKKAQSFMQESFKKMNELLKKKVPEAAPFAELALMPVMEIFESKGNIEDYFKEQIGFLFFPFGKKFVTGDTLKTVEFEQNPFNPTDSVETTSFSYLSNINKGLKTCSINTRVERDMSDFVKMMKEMMKRMYSSLNMPDSIMEKTNADIDQVKFEIKLSEVILYKYSTGWPLEVTRFGEVLMVDPTKNKQTVGKTTITVK